MKDLNINVAIVGLGLIGGCFTKSIKSNLNVDKIWAIDVNKDVLDLAKEQGFIHEGILAGSEEEKSAIREADLIILCTYPKETVQFVEDNMNYFKSGAIITDAAGIKSNIMKKISDILREDLSFIGGHPMAGREVTGFQNSSENIFKGAQYILVSGDGEKDESSDFMKQFLLQIGFGKVIELTAAQHDNMVAFTSQLPHIIACTLMNNNMVEGNNLCVGGSFMDATRVAKINCELWMQLFMENKTYVGKQLKIFIDDMKEIYDLIENEKCEELKEKLCKGSDMRKEMDSWRS
ncbi:prephenate dehydrogenase [Hathewaya proteolytica DSM 3090]|uniref:Prephenate dehydrogenase n=1 Tax=Hathewaya proteolytica DSM 3090 TaxID=1121331 RepID=A0A1M6QCM6_9CLOT|nr:prephenate dehydrogenase [Hathewaya proteolytica]SHK17823.1 prephenate dehydrogenase [Hathewaya proteolytica DSM 3090]